MEHAKKMVLVPQDTLARMQASRRLEQTPITRVVHGLDTDLRKLMERQDLSEGDKIKLYQQTLQRYIALNNQRMAPLSMTLKNEQSSLDGPTVLKKEPPIEPIETKPMETKPMETKPLLKVDLKEEVGDDEDIDYEGLRRLFATASHLPTRKKKRSATATDVPSKKRKSKRLASVKKQKWTTL